MAKAIKRDLATDFDVDIWNERLFEVGDDTLSSLLRFLNCYDFAVLVLGADDLTVSRKKASKSPRDNVVFELGLFMGALGRRRAIVAISSRDGATVKVPSDLLGNTAVVLNTTRDGRQTAQCRRSLAELRETIVARSSEPVLQQLPSTALAIGYFENFVTPVCRELLRQEKIRIGTATVPIRERGFEFNVVLPKSLDEASSEGAAKYFKSIKATAFQLTVGARPYPFGVGAVTRNGCVMFYDFPTTLRASYESVRLVLAAPSVGVTEHHTKLCAREIRNFALTLGILLLRPQAAEFRESVKIREAN